MCLDKGATLGYLIFNDASGLFVEYSMDSPSPYQGHNENLFYAGPTYYYVQQGSQYVHTITAAEITLSQRSNDLQIYCQKLNADYVQQEDTSVTSYLNDPNIVASGARIATPRATNTYITDYTILQQLRTKTAMGYYEVGNGVCGYVGANLVLYYWQRRKPSSYIVPNSWYNTSGLTGSSLTEELYRIGKSLGYGTSTYPADISAVLKRYCSDRSISATVGWSAVLTGWKSEINNNRPTIIFGNLGNPSGGSALPHAVVAYGYNSDGKMIVHYGWENYPSVLITPVATAIGGNTHFRP